MQRILLALGVKNFEKALQNSLSEEYTIVGEALYKEAIFKAIKETAPNILIIRENLPGNTDILQIVERVRTQYSQTRIIFIALNERKPGSPFLAHLVTYGVYDIAIGAIEIDAMIDFIEHPRTISNAQIFIPTAKTGDINNEPLFQTKEIVVKSDEIEVGKNKKKKIKVNDYSGEKYFSTDILDKSIDDDSDDIELDIDDYININLDDSYSEDSDLEFINENDDFEIELDDNNLRNDENIQQDLKTEELDIQLDDFENEDLDIDDINNNNDEHTTQLLNNRARRNDELLTASQNFAEFAEDEDNFDIENEESIELNTDIEIDIDDEDNIDIDDNLQLLDNEDKNDNGFDFDPYGPEEEIVNNNRRNTFNNLKNIKTAENSKDILGDMVDGMVEPLPEDDEIYGSSNDTKFNKNNQNSLKNVNFEIPTINLEEPKIIEKAQKKSPFINRLVKKKEMSTVKSNQKQFGPQNRIIQKQKIVSFVSPKIGVGNTQIAFNTALKIATTGAKVLFIETSEDSPTIDYLYNLGYDNKGLDFILAGNNNFMDNTILNNIVSIPDKKKEIFNTDFNSKNDLSNELAKKAINNFPDSFNYLFFSKNFQKNSRLKKQIYNYEKFVETITLLLSQYDYEYIIIDADFDISNLLLPYILKYSSQLYITLTQDIEVLDRYNNYLKPYLNKNINNNMNKYLLLNKERKVSMNTNAVSGFVEENILASLENYFDMFLESNLKAIPIIMNQDEKLQLFFDVITKTIIGR